MFIPHHIAVKLTYPLVNCWNFQEGDAARLKELLPNTEVKVYQHTADFLEGLPEADACMVWSFHQEWFARAPKLRILSTPAAGRDYFHVMLPAGVKQMNGQFHGQIIGETVAGFLLGMCRGILPAVTEYVQNPWPRGEVGNRMRPLRGSTVLLLGFGHVGEPIGRILKGFGTRIVAMRNHWEAERPDWFGPEDLFIKEQDLDQWLSVTDHLVLALPSTPQTDNIIDARRMALLPQGATISSVGRGNVLDEAALVEALVSGHLAGACLDVFKQEPLPPESPLLRCPHLWRLPHASAITPEYLRIYVEDFVRQLQNGFMEKDQHISYSDVPTSMATL